MTMHSFRLLDTGLLTAAENMALDEVIIDEVAAGRSLPTLRFLRFSPPAALVGRNQDVALEIREDFCRAEGIDINRRLTGGGAIYFQTSALGWELFNPQGQPPFNGSYEKVLAQVCLAGVHALAEIGVSAAFRPRNDIEVEGRKISGTGGAYQNGAFMFQGTLLIENEIELFLKSLRVPVEKLKKREIESLQQRVCFLNDLMAAPPETEDIKAAFVRAFARDFNIDFQIGGLTGAEREALSARLSYYQSGEWIYGRTAAPGPAEMYWALHQTEAGTIRARLWLEPRGDRIRQALLTGDFFCRPSRFVLDLEAALRGVKAEPEALAGAVEDFYRRNEGEFLGIPRDQVVQALLAVLRRRELSLFNLEPAEVNEIFLVNVRAAELKGDTPRWLLLPYCSKNLDCEYRTIPDCGQCGGCEFDRMYATAQSGSLAPYSVQSFEHLMEVLHEIKDRPGFFVGSCCEAFYAKHQREMEETGARGLLVNLDSTTCYDLGKGMEAYVGRFDNKTEMNCELIEKLLDRLGKNGRV